jgi:hypothetical protein
LTRDIAQGVPICGVTGRNGAGKTLLAVDIAITRMRAGRRVFSTVPIASKDGHRSEPILSLRQLLELENAMILLDDVSVIFSSRSSQSLPPEVVTFLQTVRHRRIDVLWTAPAWLRCDNILRSLTQGCIGVVPYFKKAVPGSPWKVPRVVLAGLMDTSVGKADAEPTKVLKRAVYLPRRLSSWGAYDSHADTPLLGVHMHAGVCPDCGGSVTREKHSKTRHERMGLPWFDDSSVGGPAFLETDA